MRDIVAPLTNDLSEQFNVKTSVLSLGAKMFFRDGPVSGGVEGARNGVISMMVGGDEATLNAVRDTPSSFCGTSVQIGSTGPGDYKKFMKRGHEDEDISSLYCLERRS